MNRDERRGGALQDLLDELREKHGVVGATLGVLKDGTIETAASGLLNLDTQVECTPQSVFQIGSIGKIFTTTLIMQLIDEGRLDLDAPVTRYLRDFTLADRAASRAITVRHLLNHTSGMDGDFFPADDSEGPSTASYVRKMWLLPNLYPPGKGPVTYCNAGFVTAGRIIEVLTGLTWPNAVMTRIVRPLGLPHAYAHPHEALRFRCAMGHVADPNDMTKIGLAPATFLSLSAAAAGSVLSMSVESLLLFAKAHLAYGAYGDGKRLISEASARRMREETTPVPPFARRGTTHWGLGWSLGLKDSYRMMGHDGGTLGHYTYLRIFPERDTAFALFTNSPSVKLVDPLEERLTRELAGVDLPEEPPKTDFTPKPERYVGRYANIASDYAVEETENGLAVHARSKIGFPDSDATLEPWREDVFTMRAKGTPIDGQKVSFLGGDKSQPAEFIRNGLRMARRIESTGSTITR